MSNKLFIYDPGPDSPPESQILVTGQTVSYNDYDDGYLEEGISRDFSILTVGQYAGTTNIVINGKTHALSNNCVKDTKTGLTWARYVPLGDIGPDNNGRLYWVDAANAEDIWSFLAQANLNSLGGYSNWRVPNVFELISICDVSVNSPCIDTVVFPSTPSTNHWTSTTRLSATASALQLIFNWFTCQIADKATIKYYCRLVRG